MTAKLQSVTAKIEDLKLDPANARKHNKKNLAAIEASLKRFGQVEPLVVQKATGIVIGGNGRLEAMKAMKWKECAIVEVDIDATQAAALGVALNRTAELGEWNEDTLGKLLHGLREDGLDLAEIGFDMDDLTEFKGQDFGTSGITEENQDEVPEVKESFVNRGEIWKLGDHRLMCGDSTSREDVERLMAGEKADAVVSDPPYGMNLDTDYSKLPDSNRMGKAKKYKPIEGDDKEFDPTHILQQFSYCNEIVLFGGDYYAKHLPVGSWYVWDKRVTENFDRMIGSAFELIWSKTKHKREIARINNTLFSGEADAKNKVHLSQKPIKLIEWLFERVDGKLIVEPYLGSGSTLIACEKTNRKCFGMEIDPHYASVIVKRWQDATGKTAVKLG